MDCHKECLKVAQGLVSEIDDSDEDMNKLNVHHCAFKTTSIYLDIFRRESGRQDVFLALQFPGNLNLFVKIC